MNGVGGDIDVVGDDVLGGLHLPPHQDPHQVVIEDIRVQVDITMVTITVAMDMVTVTPNLVRFIRRICIEGDAPLNT